MSIRSRIRPRYKAHLIHKYRDEPEAVVWPMSWLEERIVSWLWAPVEWCEPEPWMVRMAIDLFDVTEADVRDVRLYHHKDAMQVRLWNWRTFDVAGRVYCQWR